MLASLIFPAQTAAIAGAVSSVDLIQKAVVSVEQKMAAAGKAHGTGAQKAADVLTLVEPAVTQLLMQNNLHVDTAYLASIVNAVVAILNVQQSTTAAA